MAAPRSVTRRLRGHEAQKTFTFVPPFVCQVSSNNDMKWSILGRFPDFFGAANSKRQHQRKTADRF
jgi:hypothetical protein